LNERAAALGATGFTSLDRSRILQLLTVLYGDLVAPAVLQRLDVLLAVRSQLLPPLPPIGFSEADAVLITYPDQVRAEAEPTLRTLTKFADEYLAQLVNTIHILPFFPSSSDDGFAVTDYTAVDAAYGDWADVERLGRRFGLMFDAVINHASVQSNWFQGYLRDEPAFADFFIDVPGEPDLTSTVRPRTTPLLTDFVALSGVRSVWTTFSADQADLNYRNPDVLLEVLGILLFYVERGARFLRLDAVGYIWKEMGTPCIHLPQAHAIVRLIRAVLQAAVPHVSLLTETNVSQRENLCYLGNGIPEAHLAYNFALPPLVLHAFQTAQAATLTDWAAALPLLPEGTALLNMLATHDGIGLNGCRGILAQPEIDQLARRIEAAGGHVSRKTNPNGQPDAYELNINYMDALDAVAGGVGEDQLVQRFVTAHAIMLSLKGIPAIYFHSLFGSRGWAAGARATGRPRSINREKLENLHLRAELANTRSLRSRVYLGLARLLKARKTSAAFSPVSPQELLHAGRGVLALLRGEDEKRSQVLCIHNVTAQPRAVDCSIWSAGCAAGRVVDMIGSRHHEFRRGVKMELAPFEALWLRIAAGEKHTID
jgi:glucosylglycerate phosphorylase